ncbi:MAG: hypothetical protein LAN71_14745 [Acidobacteriia bacterium]|nr:hypothetical protein [Terriglobia bacterium]
MKCTELERFIEQQGLDLLGDAQRDHLAVCAACKDLVADFAAMTEAARELPAEVEPPQRLWIALRAQLEAEKIIRTVPTDAKPAWTGSLAAFFRLHALQLGFAVAVLAAAAIVGWPPEKQPAANTAAYAETAAVLAREVAHVETVAHTATSPVNQSLRANLQVVDNFIADCERRVQQEPQDEVAHEYLSGAYQQKAEILAAMMDTQVGEN